MNYVRLFRMFVIPLICYGCLFFRQSDSYTNSCWCCYWRNSVVIRMRQTNEKTKIERIRYLDLRSLIEKMTWQLKRCLSVRIFFSTEYLLIDDIREDLEKVENFHKIELSIFLSYHICMYKWFMRIELRSIIEPQAIQLSLIDLFSSIVGPLSHERRRLIRT